MKTRERIVEAARQLFNEQGYEAVTTAALAAHCGIAEGNLWYHFKTKRALLEVIGEGFSRAIEARLALVPEGDPLDGYVRLLGTVMAEFRDYRFIYRDQPSYGEHAEAVRARAPEWIERTYAQLEAHLAALAEAGLLDWPRERLHDLAINATIVLRYGLEHYRELGLPTGAGSGVIRRTLLRHLTMFEAGLTPEVAQRLRDSIDRIDGAETSISGTGADRALELQEPG